MPAGEVGVSGTAGEAGEAGVRGRVYTDCEQHVRGLAKRLPLDETADLPWLQTGFQDDIGDQQRDGTDQAETPNGPGEADPWEQGLDNERDNDSTRRTAARANPQRQTPSPAEVRRAQRERGTEDQAAAEPAA